MGWNDHVEFVEMECLRCGREDTWEFWDSVGIARYSGDIGQMLNVHTDRHNKCPHCGGSEGREVGDDENYSH